MNSGVETVPIEVIKPLSEMDGEIWLITASFER